MFVCMVESCMICYVFYFESQRAKRYGCDSGVRLLFHIFIHAMQSQNDKCRRICICLL